MCKYCKLVGTGIDGEMDNGCKSIVILRDGSRRIDVTLYRYVHERSGQRLNELAVEESVVIRGSQDRPTVKEKSIPIAYCPFCGEKL